MERTIFTGQLQEVDQLNGRENGEKKLSQKNVL